MNEMAVLREMTGPCFSWKSYSIENMLAKVGWPAEWGEAPVWRDVLLDHASYVAVNRLHRELRRSLETLRLARFAHPTLEEPLRTKEDVGAALARDKHLIEGYDVEARFTAETVEIEAAIHASVDEGHALVNGKWLVEVFAPRRLGAQWNKHTCREHWAWGSGRWRIRTSRRTSASSSARSRSSWFPTAAEATSVLWSARTSRALASA